MNELISITFSTAETDPSIFLLYLTNKLMDAQIDDKIDDKIDMDNFLMDEDMTEMTDMLIDEDLTNQMDEQTDLLLLRQAVAGLAGDAGYLFCYSCNNYGKIGEYYATICNGCNEWTCEDCTEVKYHTINNHELELCDPCYHVLKDVVVLLKVWDYQNNKYLDWSQLVGAFNDPNDLIEYMVNILNDYFDGGENYQYSIDLINVFRSPDNNCCVLISFVLKEEYEDDDPDTSATDLFEDLISHMNNDTEMSIGTEFDYIIPGALTGNMVLGLSE